MRKKLEGNGLWESSRMMLPEHKAAINQHEASLKQRHRVELDEQEWEHISRSMTDSLKQRHIITIQLFHPLEERIVNGIVDRIDPLQKRFMINGEWYPIKDIEGSTIDE